MPLSMAQRGRDRAFDYLEQGRDRPFTAQMWRDYLTQDLVPPPPSDAGEPSFGDESFDYVSGFGVPIANPNRPPFGRATAGVYGSLAGRGTGGTGNQMVNQLLGLGYSNLGRPDRTISDTLTAMRVNHFWPPETSGGGGGAQPGHFGMLPSGDGVLQWSGLINTVGNEFGIPPEVLAAIMDIESGGNPSVVGPMTNYGVSAMGLMQVMPNWFQGIADNYGGDLMNPETNLRTAAHILSGHYDKFGDWEAVARAYFAGEGGMWADQRQDAVGTNVAQYAQMFNENRARYEQLLQHPQSGATGHHAITDPYSAWEVFGGSQFPVSQEFGHTSFSQNNPGAYGEHGHPGIDIAVPSGTALYAPFGGEVTHAGLKGGYGGTVIVRTQFGYLMLTHMKQIDVSVGQQIDAGSVLGLSGGNDGDWGQGFSTGAHVHFEVRDHNGNPMDPRNIFVF